SGDSTKLLGHDELTQEEENIAKKMILVGILIRSSINEKKSLDALKAPPKPLLHMPMQQNIAGSSQPSGESSF
ncbi:hypothetical protein HID58_084124, partial [Brassica napus]